MENSETSAPKEVVSKKKQTKKDDKIRLDEFTPKKPLPKFAREVVKKHLRKEIGPKGTRDEYQSELDKFLKREVK